MINTERYDRQIFGYISGFLLPLITGMLFYLFSNDHQTAGAWVSRIVNANILTHAISLCVVPNIVIFLIFNRFDMLKASRGVLGITIIWAAVVFAVKFLT